MLGAVIILWTLVGLIGLPRARVAERRFNPGVWLLVVTAAIYLNQVFFTIYAARVHHGDMSFVARYLPDGWFALADLGWLTDNFPAPELLSWSLFRVQSFLELPFVVLACLTVCRWFGPELYKRAAGLSWAVSASFTITFCLIEGTLSNPYTTGNIIIRVVSGVLVAVVVPKLGGIPDKQLTTTTQLVGFLVSTAALGALILVVYDTALLYNLGHLPGLLPYAVGAAIVLVVARKWLTNGQPAGPGVTTVTDATGWFLGYFLVPALPIRYGLIFGAPWIAAGAGLAVTVAAIVKSVRWNVAVRVAAAATAGLATAFGGYLLAGGYPEVRLLAAAAAFGVGLITVSAVIDRLYWR